MTPLLFVYGTLRRAHPHTHRLLGPVQLIGTGSISGVLYDLGRYPGVSRSDTRRARVQGELYQLQGTDLEAQLAAVDRYEGPEYVRSLVQVQLRGGKRKRAWTYVLKDHPPSHAREIPSGRYPVAKPGLPAVGER